NIEPVRTAEGAGKRDVVVLRAARHADAAEEGAVGSCLRAGIDAETVPPAALGDDVDDAGRRIRTPEGALRTAQNLDPIYVGHQQGAEIEFAGRGLARLDAVYEDQQMIGLSAAHANLRGAAKGAGTRNREARHLAQRIGDVTHLVPFELL